MSTVNNTPLHLAEKVLHADILQIIIMYLKVFAIDGWRSWHVEQG